MGAAQRRTPDRTTEVIVYCSDAACDSSVIVADRLVELGYENVRHYVEGKNDWVAADLPLEGGRAALSEVAGSGAWRTRSRASA